MSEQEQSPEEIRREIEQTRANLGETLHDIEDKVSPSRIAERRTEAVRSRWQSVKESVMGARDDASYRVSSQGQQVGDRAAQVGDRASQATQAARETVSQAPQQAIRQARGNPLAAGLVAFGGGLLLASILPATEQEQQAASTLKDRYQEPLKQEFQQAGQQAKEGLQGSVQQAAEEVKSTAQEAAEQTRGEAQGSAETVRDDAQRARQETARRT